MESNWGLNVENYGIGGWGVQPGLSAVLNPSRAATILTGPLAGWWLMNVRFGNVVVLAINPAGTQFIFPGSYGFPPDPGANFPYGFDVSPD